MIRIYCLLIALLLIQPSSFSQHTNVMITDDYDPNEPSICINPKNPMHMVAGSNLDNVFFSTDGGYNWNVQTLTSTYGVWGDPVIMVDTAGGYYFFHLSNPAFGHWIDRIVCQKKDSIGKAWSDGTYFGLNGQKQQDKQWAVVDPQNNNIYVTWTEFDVYGSSSPQDSSYIRFTKSLDGGLTWSAPKRINHYSGDCVDMDETVEGAVPAVGPNGEIYVCWANASGIVFNKSLDQGETWLNIEKTVSDMPGGWDFSIPGINRSNGLPVTCCDISQSPYRGNIYVNWIDHRTAGHDPDVWLAKSSDGGLTWSNPKRVNDDNDGNYQFFTWMTVDQKTGYLYFVFYDRRNYSDNNTDVYMAVSKDGGDTFVNFKISSSPFVPVSSVFFGDYTNISAYNNIVRPIWARCDMGQMSIYTAIIDTNFLGVDNHGAVDLSCELEQNYPNPITTYTFISFKLRRPDTVSLKIFDLFGKLIEVMFDHEILAPGKYVYQFDNTSKNLKGGVYYYCLTTSTGNKTGKMIIE